MKTPTPRPMIGVSANAMEAIQRRNRVHATGERNIHALMKMVDCIPVLLPPMGTALDVADREDAIDLQTVREGRANAGKAPHANENNADEGASPSKEKATTSSAGGATDSSENARLQALMADLKSIKSGRARSPAAASQKSVDAFEMLGKIMGEAEEEKSKHSPGPKEELGILPKAEEKGPVKESHASAEPEPRASANAYFAFEEVDLFTRIHQKLESRSTQLHR